MAIQGTAPADPSGSTSRTLLERIRSADPVAWRRLVELYGPVVRRWAQHLQLQASDAADITQEVFRAVAEHIAEFHHDGSGYRFRSWLKTITVNKVRDQFRRRAREAQALGGSEARQLFEQQAESVNLSPAQEEEGLSDLCRRALQLIQSEFEETTWKAFWQTAVEDRLAADVAADLGMSLAAVYKAKSRVLHRVREEFSDLLE